MNISTLTSLLALLQRTWIPDLLIERDGFENAKHIHVCLKISITTEGVLKWNHSFIVQHIQVKKYQRQRRKFVL